MYNAACHQLNPCSAHQCMCTSNVVYTEAVAQRRQCSPRAILDGRSDPCLSAFGNGRHAAPPWLCQPVVSPTFLSVLYVIFMPFCRAACRYRESERLGCSVSSNVPSPAPPGSPATFQSSACIQNDSEHFPMQQEMVHQPFVKIHMHVPRGRAGSCWLPPASSGLPSQAVAHMVG